MTSREWRSDRRRVFERDGYTCCNCRSVGGEIEPTAVRTYPVGDIPLRDRVHPSLLVTVCERCFGLLQESSDEPPAAVDNRELFRIVRRTTRTQGATVATAASFASHVTSLPATIERTAADSDPDLDPATSYLDARRDLLLALDIVDTHLSRIETLRTEPEAVDSAVRTPLAAFSEQAATLQSELRTIVELSETVVTGLGRCHGCFQPTEALHRREPDAAPSACQRCGLDPRPLGDWRRSDTDATGGPIAFDRLFATINDQLQQSGETTDSVTERTMAIAETLAS